MQWQGLPAGGALKLTAKTKARSKRLSGGQRMEAAWKGRESEGGTGAGGKQHPGRKSRTFHPPKRTLKAQKARTARFMSRGQSCFEDGFCAQVFAGQMLRVHTYTLHQHGSRGEPQASRTLQALGKPAHSCCFGSWPGLGPGSSPFLFSSLPVPPHPRQAQSVTSFPLLRVLGVKP